MDIRTSEWVSPGHPDKVADGIVSYILDRIIEKDAKARVALECQIKDNFVTIGGELTTTLDLNDDTMRGWIRAAVREIGYTEEYAAAWGEDNAINAEALDITIHVSKQSPQIAQGVNRDGWGDQGIMWGMSTGYADTDFMPMDHFIAKKIGTALYDYARSGELKIGLDIKTQVSMSEDAVTDIIVAAPMVDDGPINAIKKIANEIACKYARIHNDGVEIIVNGTGAYIRHASQGDCGTTGRKLAVDFYGGNCRIGGGCPWGKDPSKADVSLNIYARAKAMEMHEKVGGKTVYCAISCCIGLKEIKLTYLNERHEVIGSATESIPAPEIIAALGLYAPVFAAKNRNGLFTVPSTNAQ